MSRDLESHRAGKDVDAQTGRGAGQDVDYDQEHDPEASRRASLAGLRREAARGGLGEMSPGVAATESSSPAGQSGPNIELTKDSIDLGSVSVGQTGTSTVTLINHDDHAVGFPKVMVAGDPSFQGELIGGDNVEPGEYTVLQVAFTPQRAGAAVATVYVVTGDGSAVSVSVNAVGEDARSTPVEPVQTPYGPEPAGDADRPAPTVADEEPPGTPSLGDLRPLSFIDSSGLNVELEVGDRREYNVFVRNDDLVTRYLDNVSIDGSRAFKVGSITRTAIPPQQVTSILVSFEPKSERVEEGTLNVVAQQGPGASLGLVGRGTRAHKTDGDPSGRADQEPGKDQEPGRGEEPLAVDLIDVSDQMILTYQKLLEQRFNLVEAGMRSYQGALENFQTVVDHASKNEAVPMSDGVIAMKEVTKHVRDHLVSYLAKQLPGGSELGELFLLGSIGEAVAAERDRSKKAGESNVVKDYIVNVRSWIVRETNAMKIRQVPFIGNSSAAFEEMSDPARKESIETSLRYDNALLAEQVTTGAADIRGRFLQLAAEWINNTSASSDHASYIRIRYDRDWNLMGVHVEAPRGERLAEEMTREGPVDLARLPTRRVIQWQPVISKDDKLRGITGIVMMGARLEAEFSGDGALVELRSNENVEDLMDIFKEKLQTLVLPTVSSMSGTSSE